MRMRALNLIRAPKAHAANGQTAWETEITDVLTFQHVASSLNVANPRVICKYFVIRLRMISVRS